MVRTITYEPVHKIRERLERDDHQQREESARMESEGWRKSSSRGGWVRDSGKPFELMTKLVLWPHIYEAQTAIPYPVKYHVVFGLYLGGAIADGLDGVRHHSPPALDGMEHSHVFLSASSQTPPEVRARWSPRAMLDVEDELRAAEASNRSRDSIFEDRALRLGLQAFDYRFSMGIHSKEGRTLRLLWVELLEPRSL